MRMEFTEINGKKLQITDMEYLYTYKSEDGEEIAVFEYQGERIEKKVIKDVAS
jgi:hypothetical protein